MFQVQNRETINSTLKSCCVLQDHYDDQRNNSLFHNTTPDLQDQDLFKTDFFVSDRLVLRPTVSDHITAPGIDKEQKVTGKNVLRARTPSFVNSAPSHESDRVAVIVALAVKLCSISAPASAML